MHVLMLDKTPVQARPSAIIGLLGTFVLGYGIADSMRPRWPAPAKVLLAVVTTQFIQVAYTIHTAGHINSARRAGAPMDKVVIAWGLFNNVYIDNKVLPRQHVGRAIGGPVVSAATTGGAALAYGLLKWVPIVGALLESWFYANAIILAGSAFPSPHFDVGAILKWTVAGRTGEEALGEEAVQAAGSLSFGALALVALWFLIRGKWRAAITVGLLALAGGLDLYVLKGRIPPG
jgi:hypothetical protein